MINALKRTYGSIGRVHLKDNMLIDLLMICICFISIMPLFERIKIGKLPL